VRRDYLARIRHWYPGEAGEAVLQHIQAECLGVRQSLTGATREGAWLAAGPIRPGIQLSRHDRLFRVGNAAGEAHPVVAEGISMAMQSAWLLTTHLQSWRKQRQAADLSTVALAYTRDWLGSFRSRLRASAALAQWAMRPAVMATTLPLLRRWPALLTWGARLSGKATSVVSRGGQS
jgi:flavin-dependent dehydrogenase